MVLLTGKQSFCEEWAEWHYFPFTSKKKKRTYLKALIVKICANYHFWKTLFSLTGETVGLLLTRGRKDLELEMSKGETRKTGAEKGELNWFPIYALLALDQATKREI